MDENRRDLPPTAVASLENLTGPSRGTKVWLGASTLSIHLGDDRIIRATEARKDERRADVIARFRPAENGFEIEVPGDKRVWVNGKPVTTQQLEHYDMIEFGETGPMSRFVLHREDKPEGKLVSAIISDGIAYLKSSRQPILSRLLRTLKQLVLGILRETTVLFRSTILIAVIALAVLVYRQYGVDVRMQKQIESGVLRLDTFAAALSRARNEALTPADLKTLQQELSQQLTSASERLAVLEERSGASARVIAASSKRIAFLQGAYGFRKIDSGRMLRHVLGPNGQPLITPFGRPHLSLDGDGPVAERQFTGTGFLVGERGALLTNRHVALAWENDATIEMLLGQGFEPVMTKFVAYFPGAPEAIEVQTLLASEDSDLAVLKRPDGAPFAQGLKLATEKPTPGEEILLLGYPTGLRSMLAQSGEAFVRELQKSENIEFWSVAQRLAEANQILPLASRGIVGQVSEATVVYDAETTSGGSGGPVLDMNGTVIAVNSAILPEYGGSNIGIPVSKIRALLSQARLSDE